MSVLSTSMSTFYGSPPEDDLVPQTSAQGDHQRCFNCSEMTGTAAADLALRGWSNVYFVGDLYTEAELTAVRTNIEIDDQLLAQAMTAAGLSTKRATVEEGLRLLVQVRGQTKAIAELRGLGWEGDLDAMRDGRPVA